MLRKPSSNFLNAQALKTIYFSYARSKLEYFNFIWNLYYIWIKVQLEHVQKKFLKYLPLKVIGYYPERRLEYGHWICSF